MVIDTGAKDLILFSSRIKGRFGDLHESGIKTVQNMNSQLTLQRVLLQRVRVGGESIHDVEAYVLDNAGQGDPGFDGLLGIRALDVTEVAFDFERKQLSWR